MQVHRYTRTAIMLHWVVAVLMIVNVGLAWTWPYVADESVRPLINNHKSIGITLLALVTCRLLWRLTHRPPPFPGAYATWETRSAHAVHIALYLIMFAMPISGWVMDSAWERAAQNPNFYFGLFEWPRLAPIMALGAGTKKAVHDVFGSVHEAGAYVLYVLVAVHIAGALKHQLAGHPELARMGAGKGAKPAA